MICKNCGKNINVIGRDCPHCHASLLSDEDNSKKRSSRNGYDQKDDKLTIISALIPIYGLYVFLTSKNDFPLKASCAFKGVIGGFILWILIILIIIVS